MNQEKIGKFISENRKKQNLTQQELADKLNISKNAVSKWERGINLPDVSIMQDLCEILGITLNELFSGERISDDKYIEKADDNLYHALENSTFTLKEKIVFYKKKWRKDHFFRIILSVISWILLLTILKINNVEIYIIGMMGGILCLLNYILLYNQMMIYVEKHAYGKVNDSTSNK